MQFNKIFYNIKPFIPRRLQIFVRRRIIAYKRERYRHIWPIDPVAGKPPIGWQGWPNNKKIALILSHDVDTQKGHDKCYRLMEIEESLGFRSSFNFVAEKYAVSKTFIEDLKNRGFEVCVHGLYHDGKLFFSRNIFNERAKRINEYLKEWGSTGFTSPSMHHNLDWMHALNITHSTSTFDTDPFEPQQNPIGTIFPFRVKNSVAARDFVELPYTLPQDFTLFILMKEKNNKIWKDKLDWIAEKGGMALLNAHPDYMNFNKHKNGNEEYDIKLYIEFLEYIKSRYKDQYWHALPKDIARFWKQNYSL
jgi:hypothetical protein